MQEQELIKVATDFINAKMNLDSEKALEKVFEEEGFLGYVRTICQRNKDFANLVYLIGVEEIYKEWKNDDI